MILSFVLFSCVLPDTNNESIFISQISLSPENRGLEVEISFDETKLSIDSKSIDYVSISYTFEGSDESINMAINGNPFNAENQPLLFTIHDINPDFYNLDIEFIAFFYLSDEKINIYAIERPVINMYQLALEDDSEFADEIIFLVENDIITTIEFDMDTSDYSVISTSEQYVVSLSTNDEDIIITIIPEVGYRFVDTVSLTINDELIQASKYTIDQQTLTYTFKNPNIVDPLEYVDVDVTFDTDGGYWHSDIFQGFVEEDHLILTSLNDVSGVSFTLADPSITTLRWFYKLFLKYNETYGAYEVVSTDRATAAISDLTLPAYDYVLAIHDNCQDQEALDAMILYTTEAVGLLLITFDSDVELYTSGSLGLSIYNDTIISQNYVQTFNEAVDLPEPFKPEYTFLGWSDGQRLFQTFPRYQAQDNTLQVTYVAVWEADTMSDVELYLSNLIPDIVSENLDLPTSYSDFSILWVSSDPEIISDTGDYKRPYQATTVTLSATITQGEQTLTKYYTIEAEGYKSLNAPIASSYIYRDYHLTTDEFFNTLDIINCAFITADSAGNLTGTNFLANVANYIMPRARANGDWVIVSIAPDSEWTTIATSTTRINTFADNIVNLINTYGFDGVDIDWEIPLPTGTQYTVMMEIISTKVKANNPNHLVTAAIAGGTWQPPSYDLVNSHQYLDYINMMTYGMVSNNGYYQNALYRSTVYDYPTFNAGKTLGSCSIAESVAIYNSYGIPNSKIIVGVAFYGIKQVRSYDSGTSSWSSWSNAGSVSFTYITNNYLTSSSYKAYYDSNAGVPYIVKTDGTEFISYDNARSIGAKSLYIIENELGGMMYWENGLDSTGALLNAMKTGLFK